MIKIKGLMNFFMLLNTYKYQKVNVCTKPYFYHYPGHDYLQLRQGFDFDQVIFIVSFINHILDNDIYKSRALNSHTPSMWRFIYQKTEIKNTVRKIMKFLDIWFPILYLNVLAYIDSKSCIKENICVLKFISKRD